MVTKKNHSRSYLNHLVYSCLEIRMQGEKKHKNTCLILCKGGTVQTFGNNPSKSIPESLYLTTNKVLRRTSIKGRKYQHEKTKISEGGRGM